MSSLLASRFPFLSPPPFPCRKHDVGSSDGPGEGPHTSSRVQSINLACQRSWQGPHRCHAMIAVGPLARPYRKAVRGQRGTAWISVASHWAASG